MSGFFQELIMLAWGAVSLVVALVAFLANGFKGVFYSVVITWVAIPGTLFVVGKGIEYKYRWEWARIKEAYVALCIESDRETIRRTAQGITEVAIWPPKGPLDGYSNDLFFRTATADKWVQGRDGGRYGGFRNAVLSPPDSWKEGTPRYQVVFRELVIEGKPAMRGMRIQVIDKQQNLLLAERVDYVAQWNFGSPRGCASPKGGVAIFPSDDWFSGNLRFIHKVLNPPAGVAMETREIPKQFDIDRSAEATKTTATVQELPGWKGDMQVLDRSIPPEIRFQEGHRVPGLQIEFIQQSRDLIVPQNLPRNSNFLAIAKQADRYTVLFWVNDSRLFVLRHFNLDGDLVSQELAGWPDGVEEVSTMVSPTKTLYIEPAHYQIRVAVNRRQTKQRDRDFEVKIPRGDESKGRAARGPAALGDKRHTPR